MLIFIFLVFDSSSFALQTKLDESICMAYLGDPETKSTRMAESTSEHRICRIGEARIGLDAIEAAWKKKRLTPAMQAFMGTGSAERKRAKLLVSESSNEAFCRGIGGTFENYRYGNQPDQGICLFESRKGIQSTVDAETLREGAPEHPAVAAMLLHLQGKCSEIPKAYYFQQESPIRSGKRVQKGKPRAPATR